MNNTSPKTAVILVNVGTPDSPSVKDVRKYLFQFLNDYRVIDIPWLLRKILVNLIIVPFRAPKSAKLYQMLWTKDGSPLLYYATRIKTELEKQLDPNTRVFIAMRYGNPGILQVLKEVKDQGFTKIIYLPLFPQYASSTTGTAVEELFTHIRKWNIIPEVQIISQFYDHPLFIKAFVNQAKKYTPEKFDHVIFSYHGLPWSHLDRIHPAIPCEKCTCPAEMPEHGKFCYKATCYETTRKLAKGLKLSPENYTVAFQSRLSKKWLNPFTDKIIEEKAREGMKKLLVLSPAFVADCLETIVEIGIEYEQLFKENGGDTLQLVDSLNDNAEWISTIKSMLEPSLEDHS